MFAESSKGFIFQKFAVKLYFGLVVRKMGILKHSSNFQNCIKTANKIPEYARNYKNEWLFIRGINKEFEYFVDKYFTDIIDIFVSSYCNRIKSFIEKFMKLQKLNYLKDISCFKFKGIDVENIVFLFERMEFDIDEGFPDYIKEYRDFYELFCEFYDKIKYDCDESDYL